MTEPSERETKDQEAIGEAISEFVERAVRNHDGLPDFWDENNTTERLAEHLVPLLTETHAAARREAIEECVAYIEMTLDQPIHEVIRAIRARALADLPAPAASPEPSETEWLRRLLRWCRPRLKHPSYQTWLDKYLAAGPSEAPEDEPPIVRSETPLSAPSIHRVQDNTYVRDPSEAEVEAACAVWLGSVVNMTTREAMRAALAAAAKVRAR